MKKEKNQLLIRLPEAVMVALKADAVRCRRSNTKHVEAIIVKYLRLEDIEMRDTEPLCAQSVVDEMAGMIETDEQNEAAG